MPVYGPDLGITGTYELGGVLVPTENFVLQYQRATLTGATGNLSLQGTGEVYITDFGAYAERIVGAPRVGTFVVPDGYVHDLFTNLNLAGTNNAQIRGSGELVMTDDFASRRNINLTG